LYFYIILDFIERFGNIYGTGRTGSDVQILTARDRREERN
jgi:hypothetical protein